MHKRAKVNKGRVQLVGNDLAIGVNYNSQSQNLLVNLNLLLISSYCSHESLPLRLLEPPTKTLHVCVCCRSKYQKRISVPILDRIDIHIEVPSVDYEKLSGDRVGESSESIRARVQAARDLQTKRFSNHNSDIVCNADMRVGEIWQYCKLPEEAQSLIRAATQCCA